MTRRAAWRASDDKYRGPGQVHPRFDEPAAAIDTAVDMTVARARTSARKLLACRTRASPTSAPSNMLATATRRRPNFEPEPRRCRELNARVFCPDWVGVWHVRHERVRRDDTEATRLEVLERFSDLRPRVHHERTVVLDGFTDRLTAEDKELKVGRARVLLVVSAEAEIVAGTERGQLTHLDGATLSSHVARTGEHVDQCIERWVPWQIHSCTWRDRDVRHGHGGVRRAGAAMPSDVARDNPSE